MPPKCICSNHFTFSYYFRKCHADVHFCSCRKSAKKCLKTHDHICTCETNLLWCRAGKKGVPHSEAHICMCPDLFCRASSCKTIKNIL